MSDPTSHILIFLGGNAGAIVLSAAARALPEPLPMGSRLYLFFYRFTQNLLANFDKGGKGTTNAQLR